MKVAAITLVNTLRLAFAIVVPRLNAGDQSLVCILDYDYTSSEGYPNGRKLTDDIIDIQLAVLTNGRVTTDKVSSHQDLPTTFPYLGSPHRIA